MNGSKLNCWEYHRCGREEGGIHANERGVCPAAVEASLDTIHDGKNAGRACWVVAGTFCEGIRQGTFATKIKGCEKCNFYNLVRSQEQTDFRVPVILLFLMSRGIRSKENTVLI